MAIVILYLSAKQLCRILSMSEMPFWKHKSLHAMSPSEWESLCDGCGKCCLNKLEDEDSGEVLYTNAACYLLNLVSCRCNRYSERAQLVSDCVRLSPKLVEDSAWLPTTCAYRLVAEGKDLPDWHPLISGDPLSVHLAGVSARGWTVSELDVDDLEDQVIHWQL